LTGPLEMFEKIGEVPTFTEMNNENNN